MMMQHMIFIAFFTCAVIYPAFSRSASAATMYRIGVLCDEPATYFFDQLREIGYVEHRNVEFLFKDVDVSADLDGFARKLVNAGVDLIVACGNEHAVAAKRSTSA